MANPEKPSNISTIGFPRTTSPGSRADAMDDQGMGPSTDSERPRRLPVETSSSTAGFDSPPAAQALLPLAPQETEAGRHGAQRGAYSEQEQNHYANELHTPYTPYPPSRSNEAMVGEMFTTMHEVFKKLLDSTATTNRRRIMHQKSLWVYSGKDHENPTRFLRKMEEYFEANDIADDIEKIATTGEQLTGMAKEWFATNAETATNYEEFQNIFMDRFDSPEEVAQVLAKFYGDKQRHHETITAFLVKKRNMKDRLLPDTPFEIIFPILLNQLQPEIRSRMRGQKIVGFEEFLKIATRIESDIEEINTKTKRMSDGRMQYNQKPSTYTPPSSGNVGKANPPTPPSRQENSRERKPPTPCRYCQQWHYHSTCPKNPYFLGNAQGGVRKNEANPLPPMN